MFLRVLANCEILVAGLLLKRENSMSINACLSRKKPSIFSLSAKIIATQVPLACVWPLECLFYFFDFILYFVYCVVHHAIAGVDTLITLVLFFPFLSDWYTLHCVTSKS